MHTILLARGIHGNDTEERPASQVDRRQGAFDAPWEPKTLPRGVRAARCQEHVRTAPPPGTHGLGEEGLDAGGCRDGYSPYTYGLRAMENTLGPVTTTLSAEPEQCTTSRGVPSSFTLSTMPT